MASFDVIQIDEESYDCVVRAEFATGQNHSKLLDVIHTLAYLLRRGKMGNRFEELIGIEVDLTGCQIRLRYFTNEKLSKLGVSQSGYNDVLGTWFVRYVFASVDRILKFESHPFHAPDLSVFLQDPEPFDSDPSPESWS